MVDRQAIADEIFSVSEGSLATHKVWLLVNFIERMLADRPEAPAQTSCDNSSGQKVIAVPSCVPAPVCSKCGNTLGCVSCYNETANETREYRHHVLCSGDRRFPAGDPGHSCSCFELNPPPAERTFTVEQWEKAVADEAAYQQMSLPSAFIPNLRFRLTAPKPKMPDERVREILVGCGNTTKKLYDIMALIAALDPPKPKMPEKSVEVFSMGVNNEGDERVWVVLVDKNRDHPKTCYGLREDVAKAYGSTLRAELAKERL